MATLGRLAGGRRHAGHHSAYTGGRSGRSGSELWYSAYLYGALLGGAGDLVSRL